MLKDRLALACIMRIYVSRIIIEWPVDTLAAVVTRTLNGEAWTLRAHTHIVHV